MWILHQTCLIDSQLYMLCGSFVIVHFSMDGDISKQTFAQSNLKSSAMISREIFT